jgi:hypothetical protein
MYSDGVPKINESYYNTNFNSFKMEVKFLFYLIRLRVSSSTVCPSLINLAFNSRFPFNYKISSTNLSPYKTQDAISPSRKFILVSYLLSTL